MFEPHAARLDESSRVAEICSDDGVVGFGVRNVSLVVHDATVFLHVQFVVIGVSQHCIALVFSEIMCIKPDADKMVKLISLALFFF